MDISVEALKQLSRAEAESFLDSALRGRIVTHNGTRTLKGKPGVYKITGKVQNVSYWKDEITLMIDDQKVECGSIDDLTENLTVHGNT